MRGMWEVERGRTNAIALHVLRTGLQSGSSRPVTIPQLFSRQHRKSPAIVAPEAAPSLAPKLLHLWQKSLGGSMRPYLVLCLVVLISAFAIGQQPPPPRVYGPCVFGCGPFVPLVTTPMVSHETASPNPVGARNATTGLVAGATNGTLSEIEGSTSSVYTVPVWYQGGDAPITGPDVRLWPEPAGARVRHFHRERGASEEEEAAGWIYFAGREHTASAVDASVAAKSGKKASRTYTNEDVERQNQTNGTVKYDGKTEKM
jgi:hypothetical protein